MPFKSKLIMGVAGLIPGYWAFYMLHSVSRSNDNIEFWLDILMALLVAMLVMILVYIFGDYIGLLGAKERELTGVVSEKFYMPSSVSTGVGVAVNTSGGGVAGNYSKCSIGKIYFINSARW